MLDHPCPRRSGASREPTQAEPKPNRRRGQYSPVNMENTPTDLDQNLVSVIIPAYNARDFVLDAIASVKAQQHPALEIILIDDGSTDGTAELVAANAPEVRIIRQDNAGVAAARNTGLLAARGDFITFVDADDGWFPGKLQAQLEYLGAHPEVGLVFHRWLVWRPDENGVFHWPSPPTEVLPDQPELSGWLYLPLLLDCVIHTSSVMIRRNIVEQVGLFDTALAIGEDYEYWLRVSRLCKIHKLAPVYSFYRSAPGSLTSKPKMQNFEYMVVQRALERWGRTAPDGRSLPAVAIERRLGKLAFDFAYAHLRSGKTQLARQASVQAFRHGPRRLKPVLFYLASLFKKNKV